MWLSTFWWEFLVLHPVGIKGRLQGENIQLYNLFSLVIRITWWMKLRGNLLPGHNALLFSISGRGCENWDKDITNKVVNTDAKRLIFKMHVKLLMDAQKHRMQKARHVKQRSTRQRPSMLGTPRFVKTFLGGEPTFTPDHHISRWVFTLPWNISTVLNFWHT